MLKSGLPKNKIINMNNTTISTITISSSIDNVWEAITSSNAIKTYIPNMRVISDWELGSDIRYTCYDENGSVAIWNGVEMIWTGKITELETNKKLVVSYNGSGGLVKESYELSQNEHGIVELIFTQEAVDEATAKNYIEGNEYTLKSIKKYLED
jgi:uncharacterized protein YndB with AHSA1/START domain